VVVVEALLIVVRVTWGAEGVEVSADS
jgi:hypothetical protein